MRTIRKQHELEKKSAKQLKEAVQHLKGELRLLEERRRTIAEETSRKRCVIPAGRVQVLNASQGFL